MELQFCNKENFSSKNNRRLVVESPGVYDSDSMKSYIEQETLRPCKQWIHEVISSKREADRVKLRTDEFILLPDVDCVQKKYKSVEACSGMSLQSQKKSTWGEFPCSKFEVGLARKSFPNALSRSFRIRQGGVHQNYFTGSYNICFHWLAVVTDPALKTLRDLRGCHVPLLKTIYELSCDKIYEELGIERDQVLSYLHYPPSVYQLHIHFKYPVKAQTAHDAFRIHPLLSVINNLEIDADYYAKSVLQIPVYPNTEYYAALLWGGLSTSREEWAAWKQKRCIQQKSQLSLQYTQEKQTEKDTVSVISEKIE